MPKLLLGATVLFGLLNSLPLEAQGSVSLYVCNAGKVDVDVFLSQSGKVSDSHLRPADCASVAKTVGGMEPGYVGIALADSRGQWGAAKRLDILPDFGAGVLSRVTQNVPVRHGNANVSLPMQLLFRPRVPTCTSPSTYSARANLPLNATSAQIAAAASEDASRATEKNVCETLAYTMNVEGFADTSEITFKPECDTCDKKAEAQLTPEQRAARQRQADAANQVIGTLSPTKLRSNIFKISKGRKNIPMLAWPNRNNSRRLTRVTST